MLVSGNIEPDAAIARAASYAARAALVGGALGTLLGFIRMLTLLDDPSQAGGGMAIAMMPLLYGIALSEIVFVPMAFVYGSAHRAACPNSGGRARTIAMLVAGACLFEYFVLIHAFGNSAPLM